MAYSELIKTFDRIRDYMREFYVYGFRTRNDIARKSLRSYDEERRHIEDYLGEYVGFRQSAEGKQVFISVDTRAQRENPFYRAWKSCTFTDSDITLHFLLIDILKGREGLSVRELIEIMDREYLSMFNAPVVFDESTVRKKIKEYVSLGLIHECKTGKRVSLYLGAFPKLLDFKSALSFFSEESNCGVIGSFLMDYAGIKNDMFSFKHHYITQTIDSEICLSILTAIREKRYVIISKTSRSGRVSEIRCVPLEIWESVQNGRQYVLAMAARNRDFTSIRIDYINYIKTEGVCESFDDIREQFKERKKNMFGVSAPNRKRLQSVSFTISFGDDEEYIYDRLLRERRCASVARIDKNTASFFARVMDADELLPWIRTFICRITEISFSEKLTQQRFLRDLESMYDMYDV